MNWHCLPWPRWIRGITVSVLTWILKLQVAPVPPGNQNRSSWRFCSVEEGKGCFREEISREVFGGAKFGQVYLGPKPQKFGVSCDWTSPKPQSDAVNGRKPVTLLKIKMESEHHPLQKRRINPPSPPSLGALNLQGHSIRCSEGDEMV